MRPLNCKGFVVWFCSDTYKTNATSSARKSDRATEHIYYDRELVQVPFLIKTEPSVGIASAEQNQHTVTALKYPHIYEM